MTSFTTEQTGEQPQGLTWLFSSTAACLGLLLLALGLLQVSVIKIYEGEYFTFYKNLIDGFFTYGIHSIEGWFAFFAIFGPIFATIVVILGSAMTSKTRSVVILLGALSTWGWVVYFLVNSERFEGTNWFGESLKSLFMSETDSWGSVGNWIFLALLVLSIAHLLTLPSATPPMKRTIE